MEANGKVGTVKMKPFYALKKICEDYLTNKLTDGGILERYRVVVDNAVKNKNKNKEQKTEGNSEKETAMFGQEVLEELGIVKGKAGEYVEKKSQEEEILL